jgi:hypothetical protein
MSPDGTWLYAYLDEDGSHVLPGSFKATWEMITFTTWARFHEFFTRSTFKYK